MRSHLFIRITAAAAMLAGAAGGAVTTASPAEAIGSCSDHQLQYSYGVSSTSPYYVYVAESDICIPGPGGTPLPVTIYKYVGGVGWEAVAGGTGYAMYTCTGGRYLYTTSVNYPTGFYCGLRLRLTAAAALGQNADHPCCRGRRPCSDRGIPRAERSVLIRCRAGPRHCASPAAVLVAHSMGGTVITNAAAGKASQLTVAAATPPLDALRNLAREFASSSQPLWCPASLR